MGGKINLQEAILKYLNYMEFIRSAAALTLSSYRVDLKQAFKYESESQIKKAYTEIELLAEARSAFNSWAPLSLASKNRKAATLKSFFSWAFDQKITSSDLSFQITCPKVPRKLPHFISVDEALSVLHKLEELKQGASPDQKHALLRQKVLFLLLYGGGLRVSEACKLTWAQVHMAQRSLRIVGKGSKERLITLPLMAMKALENLKRTSAFEEFVFGEKPLNTRTAYNIIKKSGEQAGLLQPLHPHALRHSFATHLLSSGANLRILQELLGHDSLQATEKYTHLGIDHLARTMESVHPLGKGKN